MATSASKATAIAETSAMIQKSDNESLPALVSRLGDDVMQLFDTKLSLLKVRGE
jgi:hypothetical protein